MASKWDKENLKRLTYVISKNNPAYEEVYIKLVEQLKNDGKTFSEWINEKFKELR